MTLRLLAALALLLALPLAAAAAQEPVLAGSAGRLTADGPTLASGELVALQWVGGNLNDAPGPFHLEAARLDVEVGSRYTEGYGLAVTQDRYPPPAKFSLTQATLDGLEKGGAHRLMAYAADGADAAQAAFTGAGGSLAAATQSSVDLDHTRERPVAEQVPTTPSPYPAEIPLGSAVQWTSDDDVQVRGTFMLSLFEWDAQAAGAEGSRTIHTGIDVTPRFGLPGDASAAAWSQNKTQAFITVHDGVLTVPRQDHSDRLAFLGASRVQVAGTLRLEDVVGQSSGVAGSAPFSAHELVAEGALSAGTQRPDGGRIPLTLSADGSSTVLLDGAAVTFAPRGGGWGRILGLAVLGTSAALALPLGVRARRVRQDHRLERAETLLDIESYQEAFDEAAPLLSSRRLGSEAAVVQAESLLCQGRGEDALRLLDQERLWRSMRPLRDYLAARAHALLGNIGAASALAAACMAAAPDLAPAVRNDPLLSRSKVIDEGYA